MNIPKDIRSLKSNGFLCAVIGFALVDLINRSHWFTFALSPVFLAIVHQIASVELNDEPSTKVQYINDIADVVIVHSDGEQEGLGVSGYLDIGLHDTMKDLIVNEVEALCFSIIGYFYVKKRGKSKFASNFIPQILVTEDEKQQFTKDRNIHMEKQ